MCESSDVPMYRKLLEEEDANSRVYESLTYLMTNSESPSEYTKYLEATLQWLIHMEHIPAIPNWDCNVLSNPIVDCHIKLAIKNQSVCNL